MKNHLIASMEHDYLSAVINDIFPIKKFSFVVEHLRFIDVLRRPTTRTYFGSTKSSSEFSKSIFLLSIFM